MATLRQHLVETGDYGEAKDLLERTLGASATRAGPDHPTSRRLWEIWRTSRETPAI